MSGRLLCKVFLGVNTRIRVIDWNKPRRVRSFVQSKRFEAPNQRESDNVDMFQGLVFDFDTDKRGLSTDPASGFVAQCFGNTHGCGECDLALFEPEEALVDDICSCAHERRCEGEQDVVFPVVVDAHRLDEVDFSVDGHGSGCLFGQFGGDDGSYEVPDSANPPVPVRGRQRCGCYEG